MHVQAHTYADFKITKYGHKLLILQFVGQFYGKKLEALDLKTN